MSHGTRDVAGYNPGVDATRRTRWTAIGLEQLAGLIDALEGTRVVDARYDEMLGRLVLFLEHPDWDPLPPSAEGAFAGPIVRETVDFGVIEGQDDGSPVSLPDGMAEHLAGRQWHSLRLEMC